MKDELDEILIFILIFDNINVTLADLSRHLSDYLVQLG